MSFTDDDIKLLKTMLYHNDADTPAPFPFDGSPIEKTKALLARLEAAELTVEIWANIVPEMKKSAVYRSWRITAGKGTE